jgi:hypothetical protein
MPFAVLSTGQDGLRNATFRVRSPTALMLHDDGLETI